ncbi:endonuclease-reverse transcriptase [Elysia marginata]|uniref:Endonuclease-reverse transcriptase n=1 Tax=Elysia marginata TaxID=1093978 RepID=A0AAV4J511_9GAST|nr:endonuclease-reverse transcriptase [Elysia marginata]
MELSSEKSKVMVSSERVNDASITMDDEPQELLSVKSLKLGKAPGVDNIPSELLKAGGEEVNNILTALCQRIWNEKKCPTEWTKSLVVSLPKKGNLRLCNNYRTISLISHPSKVMLRVILNRLEPKAEEILAEEQAGFRAGRSTVEQIFNCRILIEKHMQHQRDLFHNFIDFKSTQGVARRTVACIERIQHR